MEQNALLAGVQPLVDLMLFINNRGYDDFKKMYGTAGETTFDTYIEEKFNYARRNFLGWYRDLDIDLQIHFLNFATDFYKNR